MAVTIKQTNTGKWQTLVSLGYKIDPATGERVINPKTGKPARNVKKITRDTKADVELEVYRLLAQHGQGITEPGSMTFSEYLSYWIDTVKGDYAPNTLKTYRASIRAWRKTPAAGKKLSRLAKPDFLRTRDGWVADGLSSGTVSLRLTVASKALDEAISWGWLARNPVAGVKKPSSQRTEPTTWSEEEAGRFLSVCEELDPLRGGLFGLALLTGMREAELIGLRWQDVSLDDQALDVNRALKSSAGGELVFGPPKSAASAAPVPLSNRAVALLRRQRDRQLFRLGALPEPVFDDGFGEPMNPRTVQHSFRQANTAAGLPRIRFHDLRHTAATLMRRAGVGIEEVAATLRHASPATTFRVYSHVQPDRKRTGVDALDRALGSAG